MAHDHSHHHHHHDGTGNIRVAFLLNLGFTILEVFGGLWTNSMAILSDALHDLGDSLSLGVAYYLQKKSRQKANNRYSFGYQRFSLLGALINGVVIISGSVIILVKNIPRIIHPEPTNAKGMLLFAILGILVNGAAVWKLSDGKSLNEKSVRWHLLEDVLGWVAVLIVSVVLLFYDVPILDPLLALIIVAYVLYNVGKNLTATIRIFLQGVPDDVRLEVVEHELRSIPGVEDVHHIHIWSMDGEHHVLSVHLVVSPEVSFTGYASIKNQAKSRIHGHQIHHATIEIEQAGEPCFMRD